jgi:hypothetical protein
VHVDAIRDPASGKSLEVERDDRASAPEDRGGKQDLAARSFPPTAQTLSRSRAENPVHRGVPSGSVPKMTRSGEDTFYELTPQQRMWNASRTAKRLLSNERPVTPAERLTTLASSDNAATVEAIDLYGTGIVERLERRVAELLGKPAALWFPTGTMAQQAILRVWTSRMGCPRVAVHPLHHTQLQEEGAFSALSGLEPVYPTIEPRHPVAAELEATPGRLGAAVLELPMQELGYVLPSWDEYVAFSAVARRRDVPLHVDGARIWEARHHFGRTLPEIAAQASSIYVSMYKGIGGLA